MQYLSEIGKDSNYSTLSFVFFFGKNIRIHSYFMILFWLDKELL